MTDGAWRAPARGSTPGEPTPGRGAAWWVVGHAVPFVTLGGMVPWLGGLGLWVGSAYRWPLTLLAATLAIGGAVAAAGAGAAWRGRLAFAVAHLLGLWPLVVVVVTLPALTGDETLWQLGLRIVPAAGLAHAVVGVSGAALAGTGWGAVVAAAGAGSAAGAVGGVALAVAVRLLFAIGVGDDGRDVFLTLGAGAVGWAVAAGAHGWWWGRWWGRQRPGTAAQRNVPVISSTATARGQPRSSHRSAR